MSAVTTRFDPWGPISTVLYETADSDFVQNAVGNTGVAIDWQPLNKAESYSHGTRIRAMRRDISAAYERLNDDLKGRFAQIVVKAMLRRHNEAELRSKLCELLSDIGWAITEDGVLKTEDALVSEQFFPPNSEFDAYIAIRDILGTAREKLLIVDAYLGPS